MLRLIKSKIRADTNLKDLLWNSGVLYIGGFITILFTFTQQITTANFLGASEYGRFATVLSSSTLLLLFIDVRTWELATKLLAPAILQQDNLEITVVTNSGSKENGFRLLELLGMPFEKEE